jgi:hypothetical protein
MMSSMMWRRAVELLGTVSVIGEWFIVMALHYSHTVAACLYALQALTTQSARMSCRPMMALISGALKICARALETCVPSYAGRPARLFFMLKTCDPQVAMGHMAPPEPTSDGR